MKKIISMLKMNGIQHFEGKSNVPTNSEKILAESPEILKRRTFAIISHPDAGKTTLTEKILLLTGAINMAGQVRAKANARRATSDYMKIEQTRGISVSTSAMSFDFNGFWLNLVDTPGHADFSEDTYRTLTAVDFVVMIIDGAKGIESQTKKLFEICRLRDLPIITFCNKMDRESRDVIEIIDEIQEDLALEVAPVNCPVGLGKDFIGCYQIETGLIELLDQKNKNSKAIAETLNPLNTPELFKRISEATWEKTCEDISMIKSLTLPFSKSDFLQGSQTPLFFGSAIFSFGTSQLLETIGSLGPHPKSRKSTNRDIHPSEKQVSGFVFKVQANMDTRHRDRVAFVRLCSGNFRRGMKLRHVRSGRLVTISNPIFFLAQDRNILDEAWAGDIIGIPNHGQFMIGDTFTENEDLKFLGIPSFAPEILKKVTIVDPMKAKHLEKALVQFAEEGAMKLFNTEVAEQRIVGVVGTLQLDVLLERIKSEYKVEAKFEDTQYIGARWLSGPASEMIKFVAANRSQMAKDNDNDWVFLFRIDWDLEKNKQNFPKVLFNSTKEVQAQTSH